MNYSLLKTRLLKSFDLAKDLVQSLDEKSLTLKLGKLPSNTIGSQLWCIVGARESYLKAFQAGEWQGFDCSLESIKSKDEILDKLAESSGEFERLSFEELSEYQSQKMFELLEHEVQHHGQLIRYIYGNKLEFPASWNERYTV